MIFMNHYYTHLQNLTYCLGQPCKVSALDYSDLFCQACPSLTEESDIHRYIHAFHFTFMPVAVTLQGKMGTVSKNKVSKRVYCCTGLIRDFTNIRDNHGHHLNRF